MRLKPLILTLALVLALVPLLSAAKSYDVTFSSATRVGELQLDAGAYKLTLTGANAVFTNVDNGKRFTTTAKVVDVGTKFDDTVVETANGRVTAIRLGGTTTQLVFVSN